MVFALLALGPAADEAAEGSGRQAQAGSTATAPAPIFEPQAMHTHVARRTRSEAAREADFDEHRADVRGFGCDGCDGRDYAHYA